MTELHTRLFGAFAVLVGVAFFLDVAGYAIGKVLLDFTVGLLAIGFIVFGLSMVVKPGDDDEQ